MRVCHIYLFFVLCADFFALDRVSWRSVILPLTSTTKYSIRDFSKDGAFVCDPYIEQVK